MNNSKPYCGLVCDSCPIHLATKEKNLSHQASMRKSIAKQINQQYGTNYKSNDINDCDGCRSNTGRLFSGCECCEIRNCASQKNIENCAHCNNYACGILEKLLQQEPGAKIRLDKLRHLINSS